MEDLDTEQDDDFDKIYKGEISKSGAAILPSKRVRRMPEQIIGNLINEENKTKANDEVEQKEKKITEKPSSAENKTE